MSRLIEGAGRVPIRLWGRSVPPGALEQLVRIAEQPYVVEHVAAMPDLHVAHGVAVGTVFATDATIVPSALGGDLGCGMSAVRFEVPASQLSTATLRAVLCEWSRTIPVGDLTHRGAGLPVPARLLEQPLSTGALTHARARLAPRHLGTLGGGNHFIELDRDGGGELWLLVHSGSRGLGAAIAAHHLKVAQAVGVGTVPGLALSTEAGRACASDVDWALRFAHANREALVAQAARVVQEAIGVAADPASLIDVHHNFVREEVHFGRSLVVHRKGAIAAPRGSGRSYPGRWAPRRTWSKGWAHRSRSARRRMGLAAC